MDIPGAMTSAEVATALELSKIKNRSWFIQATSAITREGLFEGFDWLVNQLKSQDTGGAAASS